MNKLIFLFSIFLSTGVWAQFNPIPISGPIYTAPGPVGDTVIRGFPYKDHTNNTSVAPLQANLGGVIEIMSRSLYFEQLPGAAPRTLQVILQDANRPANAFGVTVFELTQVVATGMVIEAQLPLNPIFQGRQFHVTVFMIGAQPWHYAYAGTITIN